MIPSDTPAAKTFAVVRIFERSSSPSTVGSTDSTTPETHLSPSRYMIRVPTAKPSSGDDAVLPLDFAGAAAFGFSAGAGAFSAGCENDLAAGVAVLPPRSP